MDEIDAIVRDLQGGGWAPAYPQYESTAPTAVQPSWGEQGPPPPPEWATQPLSPTGGSTAYRTGVPSGSGASNAAGITVAVAVVAVLVMFFALIAVGATMSSGPSGFSQGTEFGPDFDDYPGLRQPRAEAPPQVGSVAGIEKLSKAIAKQTGSTEIVRLTLRRRTASVEVLRQDGLARGFTWNGRRLKGDQDFEATARQSFDLAQIQPGVVVDLLGRARRTLLDEPVDSYVIVQAPAGEMAESGIWITAYARNRANRVGYLAADRDGTVIDSRKPDN